MTQSFNNQSVDDVALTLARRKVGLRHGFSKPMDKLAFDLSSSLQGAGDWLKDNPAAQKALIGAGVGGTLGLGSSLFRRGKKHPFRDALTGALAGGALGGGLGLLGDRKNISDEIFPAAPNTAELAKDIEEVQNLDRQAKPTFLNSPLHWAGQTAKDHPVLSALGIGGAADVGTGMGLAAQGKNTSPGAWRNVAKVLAQQSAEGKTSQIPGMLKGVVGDAAQKDILTLLQSGNNKDLVTLSKRPDALKAMQSLRDVDEVFRPMTASQYALQEAARKAPRNAGGSSLARTMNKLPKSLPNIPKYMRGKGALVGIPAALIASWLAAKGYANTEGAQDRIRDIQQQFGN
tara:strand:+ start:18380 stop:19417 length:1038 start_codon:yes stop_codon:yes gene_type:complete